MNNVSYPKAFDKDKNIIDIQNLDKGNRDGIFYCISCGKEMVPVFCIKKASHFRHKEKCGCNKETYLHNLAKHYFKAKFDQTDNFPITFYTTNNCPKYDNCKLKETFGFTNCKDEKYKRTINLKEFYDKAEIEKSYGGFVADILLYNSIKTDRKPVFLEFFVTHSCTDEKINSGLHIIEIKIENEADILRPITETDENERDMETNNISYQNDQQLHHTVRFYNFKRHTKQDNLHELQHCFLTKKREIEHVETKSCGTLQQLHPDNIIEVIFEKDRIVRRPKCPIELYLLVLAYKRKFWNLTLCNWCYNFNRCIIRIPFIDNKTKKTFIITNRVSECYDKFPESYNWAKHCGRFSLNSRMLNAISSQYECLPQIVRPEMESDKSDS